MEQFKEIIAKNISNLRKEKKWTQLELSEKMNYSDKAISKWERAESTPDADCLYKLAQIFGVTVDYFFTNDPNEQKKYTTPNKQLYFKHLIILFLLCLTALFVCVVILVSTYYQDPETITKNWIAFIYLIPICSVMTYVFCRKYKDKIKYGTLICASLALWGLLTAIYLNLLFYYGNLWMLFFIGIPLQLAIIAIHFLRNN